MINKMELNNLEEIIVRFLLLNKPYEYIKYTDQSIGERNKKLLDNLNTYWRRNNTENYSYSSLFERILSTSAELGFNNSVFRVELISLYSQLIIAKDRYSLYKRDRITLGNSFISFQVRVKR